ncbi:uncharacterized protein FIESC28_01815 [Fusarium coffeatum]|uniref:HNH nuclease domain-containing protein n=1 Tax=Fusarium coffeatum TaxID=231269 RepID=A0A366S8Y5_9HYPO|nr:uncharacterized protein FIESC28_01815 [Fusarium coffeatum]RBR25378.1 hypothetical protein FIESC28_01815 [Fusarium coffeatum]
MSSSKLFQIPRHDPIRLPYPLGEDFAASLPHRLNYAKGLQNEVEKLYPEFRFHVEHHALCLIATSRHFPKGGALSLGLPESILKRLLEGVSPFAKHYMLHSSPLNKADFQATWGHAFYRAPIERPELTDEYVQEATFEELKQSMYYEQRYQTSPGLKSLSTHNDYEDNECRHRDGNVCQISNWEEETTDPYIFSFIPPGWNNTVDNSNATGNLSPSGRILTDVDLLDNVVSPNALGMTHKAWNMICVHADLFRVLSDGWCALKYEKTEPRNDKKVDVVCRFYWMPQLEPRFNKMANGTAEVYALLEEFNLFFEAKCPPPPVYPSDSEVSPDSGDVVKLKREEADVPKTIAAIKVHWNCVLYTALCGGAGRSQFLTGMDQRDGSVKAWDKEFMAVRDQVERNHRVEDMTWKRPGRSEYGTESTGRTTESEADFARGA